MARESASETEASVIDSETAPRIPSRSASETSTAKDAAECRASDSVGEELSGDQADKLMVVWRRSDI